MKHDGLEYVKITGPGVDALENRKEQGSPVDLEESLLSQKQKAPDTKQANKKPT